jgi:hypothetical protein
MVVGLLEGVNYRLGLTAPNSDKIAYRSGPRFFFPASNRSEPAVFFVDSIEHIIAFCILEKRLKIQPA